MPEQSNKPSNSGELAKGAAERADRAAARLPPVERTAPLRIDIKWPQNLSSAHAFEVRSAVKDFLDLPQTQELLRSNGPASYKFGFKQPAVGNMYANGYQGWSSFISDNLKINIRPETLRQLAPLGAILFCAVKGEFSLGTKLGRNANIQFEYQTRGRFSFEIRFQ